MTSFEGSHGFVILSSSQQEGFKVGLDSETLKKP